MKDILIIFAILLLLLITISTLGGSLTFVGSGRSEYFTDTVPIPKPKQSFTQPTHKPPAGPKPKEKFTEKPAQKLTATATTALPSGSTGGIEPFEGPMYATA